MENVGVLIFFAVVGAVICAKARVPVGAVAFSLVALVLFNGTPAGAGLPDAVAGFMSAVGDASQPFTDGGSEAVG
jgi:uncharacterized membrane protein AbrB (regulator of aidB expression)